MRRLPLILLAAALAASPATVAQEVSPTLTLDDAIHLALQRNKMLKVSSYGPGIARANLLVARGAFDPNLQFTRNYASSQFNTSNGLIPVEDLNKVDYYQGGVTGLLPIGTTYNVFVSTQEVRDPAGGIPKNFSTFGGFQVTQPLLRGFGFAANLEQVRIQKANRSISDQAYRQSAINTVTSVIVAYSNLQFAHDELESAEGARARANRLLSENEKKYKVGSSSQSDVIESRANAAQYEEDIIIAERAVRDDQNALRELIGEDVFFENEPLFVLAPMQLPDITIDRKSDLQRAYTTRPDYQIARLGLTQDHAVEAHARNALLPEVDFQGGYGYNGSASNFSPSRQMVEDHMNPSVSAGLVVTIPFTFAVGRGTLRAARLTRSRDEEDLKRLAADIAVAVANADGQIETTRRRVEADKATYALARQALDAEEKKNKAGTGSTYIVVQYQQSLAIAENSISGALAAERQAIATYDATIGTTLERYHVVLSHD